MMSPEDARDTILKHADISSADDFKSEIEGFLESVCHKSWLNENQFHELMAAIAIVAPTLSSHPDSEVTAALWRIVTLSREHGLSNKSTLTVREAHVLEDWINKIAWAITSFLDGEELSVAFRDYSLPEEFAATDASDDKVDDVDEAPSDESMPPRCKHLWSNGLFMNAGLPEGEEVIGDGDFWCSLTQTVLGPDGKYCDSDECRDSTRTCFEIQ